MANTWNAMTYTNIGRTAFQAFMKKLTALAVFSTDFSGSLEQGDTIKVPIVPISDDAVDMADPTKMAGNVAYDREDSNIIKGVTTGEVSVTMSNAPASGFVIPDHEAEKIGAGLRQDTQNKLITTKAYAVANFCLKTAFNLLTKATYTNTPFFTGPAAAFSYDDIVDGKAALVSAGFDLDMPTYIVLDPDYYAAVCKDSKISDLAASGFNVVRTGDIPLLSGLVPVQAASLSGATTAYDTNKVRGYVCQPSAMACAMRPIKCQAPEKMEHYEVFTDPDTGISMVYRAWYSAGKGQMYHNLETKFGAKEGQVEALSLIVEE